MKYGFLFGAGAEIGYGMPNGGKFALDIFNQDAEVGKHEFKYYRDNVDSRTAYASEWLPKDFADKRVCAFEKNVFVSIIKDTIENNRRFIVDQIKNFDQMAEEVAQDMKLKNKTDIVGILERVNGRPLDNSNMGQEISLIDEFEDGNIIFSSTYYSALLILYTDDKSFLSDSYRDELGTILVSILQLLVGALSGELTRKINDNLFKKRGKNIDLFDNVGDIVELNYAHAGLEGLEYLHKCKEQQDSGDAGSVVKFARKLLETIYASAIDYKSLIDTNWHYLYSPKSSWAKFCKTCIFLYTVRNYINQAVALPVNGKTGYYEMLKSVIDDKKIDYSVIATTNYNTFIDTVLGEKVSHLNGSTELLYDPYNNKVGTEEELNSVEHHILVPLLYTQSGTKPMTSIDVSKMYVDCYTAWKDSDAVVVVGFGFGADDEHINGILRTLIEAGEKRLIVVTLGDDKSKEAKKIKKKLKLSPHKNIEVVLVDSKGMVKDNHINWVDYLIRYKSKDDFGEVS